MLLAYIFLLFAIFMRFALPLGLMANFWSFMPLGAALLFFGSRLSRQSGPGTWKHMIAAMGLLVAADVALTRWVHAYVFTWDHYFTFAWYAVMLWFGGLLSGRPSALKLAGGALTASVTFFMVSNFGVWTLGTMYPMTLDGLMACYVAAVPFFRNTVASDLIFTGVFFGLGYVLEARKLAARTHAVS